MQNVTCKRCGTVVSETHINREEKVANCQRCGALFSLTNLNDIEEKAIAKSLKPEIYEIPKGFDVEKYSFELKIKYKTKGFAKYFFTFFTLFWNAILSVFVIISVTTGEYFMLLFCGLHILVGLGLFYNTLSMYINTHILHVTNRGLESTYGPLKFPWKKNSFTDKFNVNQIYCRKYKMGSVNNVPKYGFKVSLLTNDGEDIVLINQLPDYRSALYIEQQIEQFLEIEDKAVADEYQIGD